MLSSIFLALLLTCQDVQETTPTVEITESSAVSHGVQVENPRASAELDPTGPSQTLKGSQQTTAEIPYGEFFNKESEELPFYLRPEFGGLDGSDHRREVRPNSAGQRLDMDQYNRQVRPPVGP